MNSEAVCQLASTDCTMKVRVSMVVEEKQWHTASYNRFRMVSSNAGVGSAGVALRSLVEVLRPHLERQGRRGGQAKLSVEDQLLVAWEYWREYRSQFHIGVSWGLHETTVGRIVRKVEDLLVKCGKFRLPSQRQLYQPGWEGKVMVVDVGEIEIERPKKNSSATESGKQKCHTLKAQQKRGV